MGWGSMKYNSTAIVKSTESSEIKGCMGISKKTLNCEARPLLFPSRSAPSPISKLLITKMAHNVNLDSIVLKYLRWAIPLSYTLSVWCDKQSRLPWVKYSHDKTRKHSRSQKKEYRPLASIASIATRCQQRWGGPQVNKFEQVSSLGFQMSVLVGVGGVPMHHG